MWQKQYETHFIETKITKKKVVQTNHSTCQVMIFALSK